MYCANPIGSNDVEPNVAVVVNAPDTNRFPLSSIAITPFVASSAAATVVSVLFHSFVPNTWALIAVTDNSATATISNSFFISLKKLS